MKKYAIIGILIWGLVFLPIKSMAKEIHMNSKGSIEGMIYFYAKDLQYLDTEIHKLLGECEG